MAKNRVPSTLAVVLLLLPALGAQDGPAVYRLSALPGLGGGQGFDNVTAIDAVGAALGQTSRAQSGPLAEVAFRPVVWESGVLYELPLPAGLVGFNAAAAAINSAGMVVGWTPYDPSFPIRSAPTVWFRGAVHHLGMLPGDTSASAVDVNDAGVTVGFSEGDFLYAEPYTGVRWQGDSMRALLPLPGDMNSMANAINNAGDIVGASGDPIGFFGGLSRAVMWVGGNPVELPMLPGDNKSIANDINDAGTIVGASGFATASIPYAPPVGPMQPVRWVAGQPQALPLLPGDDDGFALRINRDGTAIGASGTVDPYGFPSRQRPVLWVGTRVVDMNALPLEPSGWTIDRVTVINDAGLIGGVGTFGGAPTAFVATPLRDL